MRLPLAFEAGLPKPETLAVVRPDPGFDLAGVPATVVHGHATDVAAWNAAGYEITRDVPAAAGIVVCLPRSKDHAKDLIARAAAQASQWVAVDGQKTDGVESIFKALRTRVSVDGVITKGHGRLFWFPPVDLSDWRVAPHTVDSLVTAPGLFSADRIDPASLALASALPEKLGRRVADFGAGWGYLSRAILTRSGVEELTAVEVEWDGCEAIRANLSDPRLTCVWGDATTRRGPYDTIVMNPPFHQGRKGDPSLGQAFITSARASLAPRGTLWMVANAHLPYEGVLTSGFAEVRQHPAPKGFKIYQAQRPLKSRTSHP